ncbi:hypothetical protein F4818DRAFT_423354 [Hypoxylon cercidicola]|nr:hypothetical protein F4818DRAFT_423354 [Hypoxylon cercidicola]
MSQQTTMLSSAAGTRRSSIASETTLVDTPSRKVEVFKKDQDKDVDRKLSLDACSTSSLSSSSSRPSIMEKAIKKFKSKLGERGSTSTSEPKPRRPASDMYPDSVYMWRALAGRKFTKDGSQPRTIV